MLRLRPLAWSGVRSGAQDGTSDVRRGAQDATSDVRCGAQVQLPAWLSNSTGSAKSLIEPIAQPPRVLRTWCGQPISAENDPRTGHGLLRVWPALAVTFFTVI